MQEGATTARRRCREIMTSDVRTATRDMSLQDAAVADVWTEIWVRCRSSRTGNWSES